MTGDHDSELPTLKQIRVPVALVVDGSAELIAALSEAAPAVQVLIVGCSVEEVATTAAEMRPLVLVVPYVVYQREWENFEALARDLRASLMPVTREEHRTEYLQAELTRLMAAAERQRPSWTSELRDDERA